MSEYQNTKMFLQKGYTSNLSEEVFVTEKVKAMFLGHVISDLTGE